MRTFNSTLAWMAALCFVLFACGEDDAPTIPEEPDTIDADFEEKK